MKTIYVAPDIHAAIKLRAKAENTTAAISAKDILLGKSTFLSDEELKKGKRQANKAARSSTPSKP